MDYDRGILIWTVRLASACLSASIYKRVLLSMQGLVRPQGSGPGASAPVLGAPQQQPPVHPVHAFPQGFQRPQYVTSGQHTAPAQPGAASLAQQHSGASLAQQHSGASLAQQHSGVASLAPQHSGASLASHQSGPASLAPAPALGCSPDSGGYKNVQQGF